MKPLSPSTPRKIFHDSNERVLLPTEAEISVCDLPAQSFPRPARAVNACPECGKTGKPVGKQTVKSMLSVSLRQAQDLQYLFCQTQICPVVYFSTDAEHTFTVEQVRERVYQKQPEARQVFICYCFRHTLGDLRGASLEDRLAIVDNITSGIHARQCACDLRNPQGSCCLGNVRAMLKRLEKPAIVTVTT